MKLFKSKKFLSGVLCSVLFLTSIGGNVSASSDIDAVPEVPKGYEVVKEYDVNDLSSLRKVPSQVIANIKDENRNSVQSNMSYTDDNKVKMVDDETRIFRDLRNIQTGEVMHQYVTTSTAEVSTSEGDDMITPFIDQGSGKADGSQSVRLTLRLFWHENATNSNYIGMDKAYYRWDMLDSKRVTVPSYTGTAKQIGPGINDRVQMNGIPVNGTHPTDGETYLVAFDRLGWVDVLTIGVGTQVGIHFTTNLQRGEDSKWSFNHGIVLFGTSSW